MVYPDIDGIWLPSYEDLEPSAVWEVPGTYTWTAPTVEETPDGKYPIEVVQVSCRGGGYGNGGWWRGWVPVEPGETLTVIVGGPNSGSSAGYNGGGSGVDYGWPFIAAGAGASEVQQGDDRVVVSPGIGGVDVAQVSGYYICNLGSPGFSDPVLSGPPPGDPFGALREDPAEVVVEAVTRDPLVTRAVAGADSHHIEYRDRTGIAWRRGAALEDDMHPVHGSEVPYVDPFPEGLHFVYFTREPYTQNRDVIWDTGAGGGGYPGGGTKGLGKWETFGEYGTGEPGGRPMWYGPDGEEEIARFDDDGNEIDPLVIHYLHNWPVPYISSYDERHGYLSGTNAGARGGYGAYVATIENNTEPGDRFLLTPGKVVIEWGFRDIDQGWNVGFIGPQTPWEEPDEEP